MIPDPNPSSDAVEKSWHALRESAADPHPATRLHDKNSSKTPTPANGAMAWNAQPADGYEVMAAAPLDRPLHHCRIVNIRGNSYRMRDRQAPGRKNPGQEMVDREEVLP